MQKYKMVLIDMDGTLLDDSKNIPDENIKVLQELNQRGVIIVIATGRRYTAAKTVLEKLNIPLVILPNNGNSLWLMEEDRKISAKYLAVNVFHSILKEGHKRGLHPILHVDKYNEGYDYVTEFDHKHASYHAYINSETDRHRIFSNLFEIPDPNVMVMCYAASMDILKNFQETIKIRFPDSIHSHITLSLKKIGPLLEISHIDGTKWQTAVDYANRFGISPDEIVAIGDDSNDIPMVKNAGLGIAMKNAISEVKEVAQRVTEYDNNSAGVAHILKSVFELHAT